MSDIDHFAAPVIRGRHVYLRPLFPEDYGFVRAAELSGDLAVRWRLRGAAVSADQWAQMVWQGVLVQFVVVGTHDPTPMGLVIANRANFQDGHAYLAVETFGSARRAPLMIFGATLFIEYVFRCWDFIKLYVEAPEYNVAQFQSATTGLFVTEGRLADHHWYGGKRWDQLILALYRDVWQQKSGRVLAAASLPGAFRTTVRMPPPR